MLSLLSNSAFLSFRHLFAGGVYALPSLLIFYLIIWLAQKSEASPFVFIVLIALFVILTTLYCCVTVERMLCSIRGKRIPPVNMYLLLEWRSKHLDLLLFIAFELLLLVLFVLYFSGALSHFHRLTEILEAERIIAVTENTHSFTTHKLTILLFGSKLLSGVFLFFCLIGWSYICRTGVRLPSIANGIYMRSTEAIKLTKHSTLQLLAVSFLLYFFFLGIITTATNNLTDATEQWQYPVLTTVQYFLLTQSHIAMWTCFYHLKKSHQYESFGKSF